MMALNSVLSVIAVALVIAGGNSYEIMSKKKIGFSETPWYSQSTYQQPNYDGYDSTGSVSDNNNDYDDNNYGGQSGFGQGSNSLGDNENEEYPEIWVATAPNVDRVTTIDEAATILFNQNIEKSWKLVPQNFNLYTRNLYKYVVRFPTIWYPELSQQAEYFTKDGIQAARFHAIDAGDNVSTHTYTNAQYSRTYVAPTTLEVDFSVPVVIMVFPQGDFGLMVKVRPARNPNARTYFRQRY